MEDNLSLTILFPLHKALPWLDVISKNIELCPLNCRILVSDRTISDNALEELRKRHQSDPRIIFFEEKGAAGWREHVNWLLPKVVSDLFSIMPQDDSITPGYYEKLASTFLSRRNTVLAFGPIVAHNFEGQREPVQFESMPIVTGSREPWEEAIELERSWNLGIAYRGVIRRTAAKFIAATERDHSADIFWVFGLALQGHLVEVPEALYHKRYHPESAHVGWETLECSRRRWYLRRELFRHLLFRPLQLYRAFAMLRKSTLLPLR